MTTETVCSGHICESAVTLSNSKQSSVIFPPPHGFTVLELVCQTFLIEDYHTLAAKFISRQVGVGVGLWQLDNYGRNAAECSYGVDLNTVGKWKNCFIIITVATVLGLSRA